MKSVYFILILIIISINCTPKPSYSNLLSTESSTKNDSLQNAAQWELYKLNVSWYPNSKRKTYELCRNRFIPFVNYIFNTIRIDKQHDTISFCFNTYAPSCKEERISQFCYDDRTIWYPYYGVRYVAGVQEGIYYGRVICKIKSENDTLFAKYLQLNQDSITNKWLLNYAERFLKKK